MSRVTPSRTAPGSYGEAKGSGYYANAREDLVAELPRPLGRVLDVGCGEGAVGRLLLAEGATAVTGIEINEQAAARAREASLGNQATLGERLSTRIGSVGQYSDHGPCVAETSMETRAVVGDSSQLKNML